MQAIMIIALDKVHVATKLTCRYKIYKKLQYVQVAG